jgi:hypothetical protein
VSKAELTRLWAGTFDETVVITVDGHEERVRRLVQSLPFDATLLRIDRYPPGRDCRSGLPQANHHVVVGERHKRIVEDARRRGLRNVVVLEDDAEFTAGDGAALRRVLEWVGANGDRWDLFYLGFMAPLLSRCALVTRSIVRPSRPHGAHAVCYHGRIFDEILSINLTGDHRPRWFRAVERVFSPRGRNNPYHRDGVGALDCWLALSRLRRFAAHPVQVVQTHLPPDSERDWRRFSSCRYDVHETPRLMVRNALAVHYALWALPAAAVLGFVLALTGW